jgi:hypothetical protein
VIASYGAPSVDLLAPPAVPDEPTRESERKRKNKESEKRRRKVKKQEKRKKMIKQ